MQSQVLQVRDYIHQASGAGVLRAIGAATENDLERLTDYLTAAELTSLERQQLRTFLVQVKLRILSLRSLIACQWRLLKKRSEY